MAHSGTIWKCGNNLLLKIDPSSGTLTQPATLDTAKLADITVTASGGSVAVRLTTDSVRPVRIPKKYPWVNLTTNQFEVLLRLDREIRPGETVTVDIPAALVSDGTRSNAAATGIAVTNRSYNVEGFNPSVFLGASARIVYVDPTAGNDTNAAAANGGLGYYVKADVGSNPAEPSISVVPYKTLDAACATARASTSGTVLARNCAVLIKRGEVVDGAVAGNFHNASRMIKPTGGTALATPFVVGQYGTSGANPKLMGQQTVAGGCGTPFAVTGASAGSYVVFLGVDMQSGLTASSAEADSLTFAANGGNTREDYFFKGCYITGNVYWGSATTNFTQTYNGFWQCVFDGDNRTGSGGIWGSDQNWPDFQYRNTDCQRCIFTNASQGGLYHGLYMKNMGNLDLSECFFYDLGGAAIKLDTAWGAHISNCVFVACNSIGNNDCNGSTTGGTPSDRTKDAQTTEYPTSGASAGVFAKWTTWERNILTDANANGTRGSAATGLMGAIGPSSDCEAIDNLFVCAVNNQSSGFSQDDSSGSGTGNTRDTWDFVAERNTLVFSGTSSYTATGIGLNPADNDTFSSNEHVGMHGVTMRNNIFAIYSGFTGATPFRFGADASDQDYSASFTAGRSQIDIDYNCFYAANGYTDAFRNGGSSDLFSTLAALESDMNGTDTSMTGNRTEDPSLVDPTYEISDYLTGTLGYGSVAAAFSDLADTLVGGSYPTGFDPDTIASYVLPKYEHGLDESNYNSTTTGFEAWVEAAAPTPSDMTKGVRSTRGVRSIRGIR